MEWTYDQDADALYVRFQDGISCRTVEVDSGALVDFDEHGTPLGVEIIHPARPWPLQELKARASLSDDQIDELRRLARGEDDDGTFNYPSPRVLVTG